MKRKKYKTYLLTYFIVFAFVMCIILILSKLHITYQPTPSMQKGIYIERFYDKRIKIGDTIRFINPRPDLKDTQLLMKKVKSINTENGYIFAEGKEHEELVKETGLDNAYSFDSNIFGEFDPVAQEAIPMILLFSLE